MFESFGFETLTPRGASVILGLLLGLAFGVLGRLTGFCLRRAVAGPRHERASAAGVWLMALAVAVLGTQIAVLAGLVDFSSHRFMAADLPWLAIVVGGAAFGAGMVLTRGCVSRLTVLTGGGNLRAALVLLVFAVVAHATLKGVLAPVRVALGSATVPLGDAVSLAALPGGALIWTAVIAAAALAVALRSGNTPGRLALAAALGVLAPLGWVATGFVLYDDFDPIALESLSFTSPSADSLFWIIASSAIPAGFGVGLLGGVLTGSFGIALATRSFAWESFASPGQTGRYMAGAALMGVGGVLAGGCTVGAGLSGVPTLSVAAVLAVACIAAGGWVTGRLLEITPSTAESGARGTIRQVQPAE